jgi:hypothetical protein
MEGGSPLRSRLGNRPAWTTLSVERFVPGFQVEFLPISGTVPQFNPRLVVAGYQAR